jgi:hypothetical protein
MIGKHPTYTKLTLGGMSILSLNDTIFAFATVLPIIIFAVKYVHSLQMYFLMLASSVVTGAAKLLQMKKQELLILMLLFSMCFSQLG